MAISVATIALLTLYICIGLGGILLLRQRGGWRIVGGVLIGQALLLIAVQVALSTIPVGIGQPFIRVPFVALLTQTGLSLGTIAVVSGLVYLLVRRALRRFQMRRQRRVATGVLLAATPLLALAAMAGLAFVSTPERERERDPLKRQITLEPGFQWSIFVQGTMDNPTTITFGPDGRLYIADIAGDLWVAEDANGDGKAEKLSKFATGFDLLVGLVWHQGELFCASSGKIEALRDSDGDGVADQRRTVVDGLPSMILKPHSNNGLAVGPDGRIYFGVGSTTENQLEQNPLAASILSMNPDGSDLKPFARGFYNTFDIAFNSSGEMFGGDNGPGVDSNGDVPPDEFNHIVEGGHYGFPYFYGDPPKTGSTRGPLVSFPAHASPTGVTFYSGNTYPQEYYDNGFQTLWNRGEIIRIEVGRTTGGSYLSRTSTFGTGFLYPIDAVTGPDGNLYVADFGTSVVYRITYDATQAGQ